MVKAKRGMILAIGLALALAGPAMAGDGLVVKRVGEQGIFSTAVWAGDTL